jgi:large conductance mechanosensitive channel
MGMLKEFKEFAMKGNVVDLAVAVIIGGAFKTIITSLVKDVITPFVGLFLGGVDFKGLTLVLQEAMGKTPAITINYGIFLQTVFDFVILAFCVFMIVKSMNAAKKKEEEAPAEPAPTPREQVLLEEIRDLLKK